MTYVVKEWTQADDETLTGMIERGITRDDIAFGMDRSLDSVRRRMKRLGIWSKNSPGRPSTQRFGTVREMNVPPEIWEQRARLINARYEQDPISALIGDPPAGYSARDRRSA